MRAVLPAVWLLASCVHMAGPRFVNGAQGRLHVDDGGSGKAVSVIFVHGNGSNLTQWRGQLDHFRPTRRSVAFDLRGMGLSDRPADGDYSVMAMSDDLGAVADALRLQRFVLVGHSYGGAVVADYAARHPDRVAGVVFVDAAGNVKVTPAQAEAFLDQLRKDKDRVARQWFAPILKPSRDEVRETVYASVHNTPADAFAGALAGLLSIDMGRLLAAYHGPRLAIAAVDIESPSSLHVQFPDLPVKKMKGVGHWVMLDKPDELNVLLDEFLASI